MASSSDQSKRNFKVCEDEKHDLECPICIFLVKEAVELPCSHLLCTECAQKLSLSAEETKLPLCCPICKSNFAMSEIHRSAYADRLVRNLNVYCPQREQGCVWKGTISTYRLKHAEVCEYETKVCAHDGCSFSSMQKYLDEHQQTCEFRQVQCQYCNEAMTFLQSIDHLAVCLQLPIHCLNEECKVVIPRYEMNQHIENECPFTIIHCTFYSFGCHQMFERRKQEDHNQKSTTHHMTLMCKQSRALENEVTFLKTEIQNQNEKIEKQKTESDKQAAKIDKQTSEIEKLKIENSTHFMDIEKQIKEIDQLKKRISHFETKPKVSPAKNGSEQILKNPHCLVDIDELLLKGADRWIRKKNFDFYENNYDAWFKRIFDLMDEKKLYKYNEMNFVKVRNKQRNDVYCFSNSKKTQGVVSEGAHIIHKGKDGLLMKGGDAWLEIHTETLDVFTHDNSSCMIIPPRQQRNIMRMATADSFKYEYDEWVSSVPYDFHVNNFIIVCLIKN